MSKDDLPEVPYLFGGAIYHRNSDLFYLKFLVSGVAMPFKRISPMVPSLHLPPNLDIFDPKFLVSLAPPFTTEIRTYLTVDPKFLVSLALPFERILPVVPFATKFRRI